MLCPVPHPCLYLCLSRFCAMIFLPCSVGKVMRERRAQVVGYTTSTVCAAMPIKSPSPILRYVP